MQADFGPRLAAQDGCGENVVEMPVREQNVAQPLSAIPHGFQAGGGIVAKSNEEYELQEVNNKLGALKKAIVMAEKM